ncbi:MAG: YlaF family protein [Bacillus sp. (in: Bacteria)]|nr:YlaF family protein [Bacillus sp. (in: firmicutes)]
MKDIKWIFVLYAILAACSIMGIGIAIGERSILIAVISLLSLILIMGHGFKTKKKMREEGKL